MFLIVGRYPNARTVHHALTAVVAAWLCLAAGVARTETPRPLATPTPQQYAWHEQERIMFVCLDPCTWQGREYDNHSTPLSKINPTKLDAERWCRAAKLWGAKEILFVAKHTGGFCWWHTEASKYGIKETPWKNGRGDVLAELAQACRRQGLNLGIYVYPGDDTWGAPTGSGGRTRDPAKQKAYNTIFRQQMTEVLGRYGRVAEVWFDGSCVIDVGDILRRYAPEAAIFQGPCATVRWPGTESGILAYPAWNSLPRKDLRTGVATQAQSNPDGDAWAPLEADTPLYNHFWFWGPGKEKHRKSLAQLMDVYYKSVGRGGVLLLNSTPNTEGLIPADDLLLYEAFGREINERFGHALAETAGRGETLVLDLGRPTVIDHVILMEDYRQGERVRAYVLEGLAGGKWQPLAQGTSVGRMKIDPFPAVSVSQVRLRVTHSAAEPRIRRLAVFHVARTTPAANLAQAPADWQACGSWDTETLAADKGPFTIDLTKFIPAPGQYEVRFTPRDTHHALKIDKIELLYEGELATPGLLTPLAGNTFNVNRTAQVTPESKTELRVTPGGHVSGVAVYIRPRPAR